MEQIKSIVMDLLITIGVGLPTIGVILWFIFKKGFPHFLSKSLEKHKKELNLKSKKEYDLYLIERDRYEKFVEEIETIFDDIENGSEGDQVEMKKIQVLFYKMALSIPDETIKAIKDLMEGKVTEEQKVLVYIELRKSLLAHVDQKTKIVADDLPKKFKATIIKKNS